MLSDSLLLKGETGCVCVYLQMHNLPLLKLQKEFSSRRKKKTPLDDTHDDTRSLNKHPSLPNLRLLQVGVMRQHDVSCITQGAEFILPTVQYQI